MSSSMLNRTLMGRHPQKNGTFWEFFPKGGGVFSNPKTFVNLPSYFWYAKIILRCQNIFYNSGEVISDQFNHLILIQNLEGTRLIVLTQYG